MICRNLPDIFLIPPNRFCNFSSSFRTVAASFFGKRVNTSSASSCSRFFLTPRLGRAREPAPRSCESGAPREARARRAALQQPRGDAQGRHRRARVRREHSNAGVRGRQERHVRLRRRGRGRRVRRRGHRRGRRNGSSTGLPHPKHADNCRAKLGLVAIRRGGVEEPHSRQLSILDTGMVLKQVRVRVMLSEPASKSRYPISDNDIQ